LVEATSAAVISAAAILAVETLEEAIRVEATSSPTRLTMPGLGVIAAGRSDANRTVVYLHGWGASKELWWNSLAGLADATRGYALDLPGTGDTAAVGETVPSHETMAHIAEWLHDACNRLDLKRVTLVGHSLGGNLAAQTALDYPDLVERLVLVDAALATGSLPRRVYWTQSPVYGLQALRATRLAAIPLANAGRHVPHDHNGGFWGPLARRAGLMLKANKSDAALQWQLKLLCANPLAPERLREIQAPMMIVHGGLDGVIPVATAKAYAEALPGCALKLFPMSHHCPMDQDPPGFIAALRGFVLA
jgi:pimeloyl-ACP methyl ester carboxylesterase